MDIEERVKLLRELDARDKKIVALRASGFKLAELAQMFGITKGRVWQILKRESGHAKND